MARDSRGPVLGGSPLGLIGVDAQPTRDGTSTFNAGKTRNINVIDYNVGRGKTSIFTGGSRLNPWPNISVVGAYADKNIGESNPTAGLGAKGENINKPYTRNTLHNNDVYDTSILNIIEKLSSSRSAALRPSDFAYLKNLGVYPNNRLMIARKFLTPLHDDLNKIQIAPKSVLITWKEPDKDFLDINVGENWVEAEANFENVLNKMGEDFLGKNAGSKLGAAMNLVPLPGFTETIQRVVLQELGIIEGGEANKGSPAGNPNLIKKAKRRSTSSGAEAWAGLKYSVTIQFDCEYEQKFISGIDPTVAFIDIIGNILAFGTQDSTTYGLKGSFANKIKGWAERPETLIKEFISLLEKGFKEVKEQITKAVDEAQKLIQEQIDETKSEPAEPGDDEGEGDGGETEDDSEKEALEKQQKAIADAGEKLQGFIDLILKSLGNTVKKYKEELRGIANALSGLPSVPWHVTIGNPLRPMFCSGDMYTDDVKITLGPYLAFNDLPTSIKASFQLKPGRDCGLQEIMAKFNTGNLRVVNVRRDYNQTENSLFKNDYMYRDPAPPNVQGNANAPASANVNADASSSGKTKENGTNEVTNKNANSTTATTGGSTGTTSGASTNVSPNATLPSSSGVSGSSSGTGGTSGT
jgi:hypothetical protein